MTNSAIAPWRWFAAFVAGVIIWILATVISVRITHILTGDPGNLVGMSLMVSGIIRLVLLLLGLHLVLRLCAKRLSDIGLVITREWNRDVVLGLAVGIFWPLLQFLVLIPLTGGANREDVVASRALIGDSLPGLIGVIMLSWTWAAIGEETLFRGHIIYTLRGLLGNNRWALVIAIGISVVLFAITHAYQGLIGILDVGVFGLIMAILYVRRGNLLAPIIAHGINDTLLLIGLYLFF